MVYVSDSLALAALEIIVHAVSYQALGDYVSIKIIFPKALVVDVNDIARLPKDWRADLPPIKLKETGKKWYFDQISAVLKVPSAIISTECNYLLNPSHPDFKKVLTLKKNMLKIVLDKIVSCNNTISCRKCDGNTDE